MEDLTKIILDWSSGNKYSEERLYAYTYDRFKNIATETRNKTNGYQNNSSQFGDVISSTTTLVHEAYLKLAEEKKLDLVSSKEFFLLVSKIMRHILIDHYRKYTAAKRDSNSIELDCGVIEGVTNLDLMTVERGLIKLSENYPRQAETFQLRYFIGLRNKEIANIHQVSESLVDKDLKFSKNWISNLAIAS